MPGLALLAYIARRLLISVPVLIGSSVLVFVIGKVIGDPLEPLRLRNPPVPRQTLLLEERRLRLDRSWPEQYWLWLKGLVLHGNFGPSVHATDNIGGDLGGALLVTLRLVVVSAIAALLKSAGIWYNQNVSAGTFYTIGDHSVVLTDTSFWGRSVDVAGHLVLPTVALALAVYGGWTRFARASVLEVMNSDYVRLARSKGLRAGRVLVRHTLRTALIPLTTSAALDTAFLLSGAIVIETVFQWHGMGALFATALRDIDVYLLMGWLLVTGAVIIVFNLIADLLYGILDPRIRVG